MAEFNDMKKNAVLSAYFPSLRKKNRLTNSLLGDFHETSQEHWSHSKVMPINLPDFLRNMADIRTFGVGETLTPLYFWSRS